MNIQAPPNLVARRAAPLIDAGINDWGGVSPVTPDHVNPEAPWPHLKLLERARTAAGKQLVERLAIYPASFAARRMRMGRPGVATRCCIASTTRWMAAHRRVGAGNSGALPAPRFARTAAPAIAASIVDPGATGGERSTKPTSCGCSRARGAEFAAVCTAADELRRAVNGDVISYVVTRNINYTNICYFRCSSAPSRRAR